MDILIILCGHVKHHFSIFHARNLWPDYVVGSDPYEFADVILIQLDAGQM